ncbi:MAG: L,D-transpeptidase, partial [Olsenella sp.]|nr:L,D-transpeptidase [Olsenella sp.]
DAYGRGLQRYFLSDRGGWSLARVGHFEEGGSHYLGTAWGHVLRGKARRGGGVLLADNDGRLAWGEGWLVTDAYDGSLQRYRIDGAPGDGLMGAHVGFFSLGGNLYYGIPDAGYLFINQTAFIEGRLYQSTSEGVLTELAAPPEFEGMFWRAQGYSSPTNRLVLVDLSNHKVGIFYDAQGGWMFDRGFDCSCGAPWSPTVEGVFQVGSRGYSFGSGYTCYYWTQFYGDYLFHSVLYYQGTFDVMDGTMGESVSHGCVRLNIDDAEYIYNTIPSGSTVVTYY